MTRAKNSTILLLASCWACLAGPALAESLYDLPLCQAIEQRDPSAQRTALLEHCDLTEEVLTAWFDNAPGEGISDDDAYAYALFITVAHWRRLREIQSSIPGPCGDGICGDGESAQACPADCDASGGTGGGLGGE